MQRPTPDRCFYKKPGSPEGTLLNEAHPCDLFPLLLGFPEAPARKESYLTREGDICCTHYYGLRYPHNNTYHYVNPREGTMYYFWNQTGLQLFIDGHGEPLWTNPPRKHSPAVMNTTYKPFTAPISLPYHRPTPVDIMSDIDRGKWSARPYNGAFTAPDNLQEDGINDGWILGPSDPVLKHRHPENGGTMFEFNNLVDCFFPRNTYIPRTYDELVLGEACTDARVKRGQIVAIVRSKQRQAAEAAANLKENIRHEK